MGKSSKKVNNEVAVAPMAISPAKPAKKGKRGADEVLTGQVKRQKKAGRDAVAVKKNEQKVKPKQVIEVKDKKLLAKGYGSESTEDSSFDEEPTTKTASNVPTLSVAKNCSNSVMGKKAKTKDNASSKKPTVQAQLCGVPNIVTKAKSRPDSSESETSSDEDDAAARKTILQAHLPEKVLKAGLKAKAPSDSSDSETSSDDNNDDLSAKKKAVQAQFLKNVAKPMPRVKAPSDSSESDTSSDEDDVSTRKAAAQSQLPKKVAKAVTKVKAPSDSSESDTSSDEDDASTRKVATKSQLPKKVSKAVTKVKAPSDSSESDTGSDEDDASTRKAAAQSQLPKKVSKAVTKAKASSESSETETSSDEDDDRVDRQLKKAPPATRRKAESSSDTTESDSEEDKDKVVSVKKTSAAPTKKIGSSDNFSESESGDDKRKDAKVKKSIVTPKMEVASSGSSSESDSEVDKVQEMTAFIKDAPVIPKKKEKLRGSSETKSKFKDERTSQVKKVPSGLQKQSKSSDSSSDSESDEDKQKASYHIKKVHVPQKRKAEPSDSTSESESDEEEVCIIFCYVKFFFLETDPWMQEIAASVKKAPAVPRKKENSQESNYENQSKGDKGKITQLKKAHPSLLKQSESSDSSSDSGSDKNTMQTISEASSIKKHSAKLSDKQEPASDSSDSESDESDKSAKVSVPIKKFTEKRKTEQLLTASKSSEESSDEESAEEETAKEKHVKDISLAKQINKVLEKKMPKSPHTPNAPFPGSKTLFLGNLSFSIEQSDVEEFFKNAGEIADIRFATDDDGRFRGFGHVEFTTETAAQKAIELNGNELLGRAVKLDYARERGSYTPHSSSAFQKGGQSEQGKTIFIRGFDKSLSEDQIRGSLQEHFSSCGEIVRMSIPMDYESGSSKGVAYIEFQSEDAFSHAMQLNNSELHGYGLAVEEARPKGGGKQGGRGGGRDGGRFGGAWRGGGGGRDRGRGGRGAGRSRGMPTKQKFGAGSAGKKTTFDD